MVYKRREWAAGGERLAVKAEWKVALLADETQRVVVRTLLENDTVG